MIYLIQTNGYRQRATGFFCIFSCFCLPFFVIFLEMPHYPQKTMILLSPIPIFIVFIIIVITTFMSINYQIVIPYIMIIAIRDNI